ncbi:MAG: PKD domain-containing protein [Planctomycetales bacterium]|nr:PKD domain-containing protein [bacterium]UNM07269.1 MAG: PKD domain-containing protein [Planctomycetales bacterium]
MLRKLAFGHITFLIITSLLLLGINSCGSGQGQLEGQIASQPETTDISLAESTQSTPLFNIGGIDGLDRQVNYTDADRLIPGSDFATALPNSRVVASGTSAEFAPEFAPDLDPSLLNPAYCVYVFNLGDYDQEIQLVFGVSDPPATEEDLYFGIANYATGRWEWRQSDGSRTLSLTEYTNYISPAGHIFFTVAMTGIETGNVDFVRIGTGFPPSGSLLADVTIGPYPLTVNFTANFVDTDGYFAEYQWDFDNNGVIDETTTEPTLEHVFEVPGTYITRVHAVDNDGMEGTNFRTINVTGVLPPNPPENVQASDGTYGGIVHISWDDPSSGINPKGYEIFRADTENGSYTSIGAVSFAFKSFDDDTVSDQTVYWYYVRSLHDTAGNSVPSDSDDGFMGILNPPTDLICGQGLLPDKISISWTHPVDGATPEGYDIFRSQTEGGLKVFVAGVDFVNFYQDDSVPDGKTYYYYIQSRRTNFSNSDFSEPATGFVSQLQTPTNVAASDDASPTIVTVTWTHSGGSQVPAGYNIYKANAVDGSYIKVGTVGYEETWDDVAATDGAEYFYKVSAYKAGWDESALSDPDGGYVGLSAPQSLNASDDEIFQVTVTWLPPTIGPDPDDYEIFRADTIDGTYVSIGTTVDTVYVDSAVNGNQGYFYYAVSRKTGYVNSPASNIDEGYAAD